MKTRLQRLTAGALAVVLGLSLVAPALADEAWEEPPQLPEEEVAALPFDVTVGSYTPRMAGSENIQAGERYTLLALPLAAAQEMGDQNEATLTPAELLAAADQAMFIGSAVAQGAGDVTFEDVRLRTAEAVVYYITGPGLATPLYEASNTYTMASGKVITDDVADHSASITLVDATTLYRYGNTAQAGADGKFTFGSLAPGSYVVEVNKPGYLPYTQRVTITDDKTTILNNFNMASKNDGVNNPGYYCVGDVDNSGVRDLDDLAAEMLYYGRIADVPQGITADLNGDGVVDSADVTLLVNAATRANHFATGTAADVTGASISVADGGEAAAAQRRSLNFSVSGAPTVTAAAFSITYRADAVQPLNTNGGLVAPVDGGGLANCLVPASGFTARLVRWKVAGESVTLSFVVTADSPKASGKVATFYYRPVSGSTASFYNGAFALDHAVALVGKSTVVTDAQLSYPGLNSAQVTAIAIDQQPGPGEDPVSIALPAAGRTAVLPLSATGTSGADTYPQLPGVEWGLSRNDGKSLDGITVEQSLLTVTSAAAPGTVLVTASRDGVTSAPLSVVLKSAQPVATFLEIQKNGAACDEDSVVFAAGDAAAKVQYSALVYDQYGEVLASQPQIDWSLSGAPAGLSVAGGALTADGTTPAGTHLFHILAQTGNLQAVVTVALKVEAQLDSLTVSGAKSATIPSQDDGALTLKYVISAVDRQGNPMDLSGDLDPTFTVSPADGGVAAGKENVSGEYIVTVSPDAQPGDYTLTAQAGEVTAQFTLALAAPEGQKAVRAAVFQEDEAVETAALYLWAGDPGSFPLEARLLDGEDQIVQAKSAQWEWTLNTQEQAMSLTASGQSATLKVTALPAGSYLADLVAHETVSDLSVTVPVVLTVYPVLDRLILTAPESLTIPADDELVYVIGVTALDTDGAPMPVYDDLIWKVTNKGSTTVPAGVSLEAGVLTVTAAAQPGEITVSLSDYASPVKASVDIKLEPAGADTSVLVLYRVVTVDGVTVRANAPVPSQGDEIDVREGQKVVITYYPKLVNQATGVAANLSNQEFSKVKWVGAAGGSFTVDEKAESGTYSSTLTAVYNGQSCPAAAKVTVYPNITALRLDFGNGKTDPPYTLTVPNSAPKTYPAKLMARLRRNNATVYVPMADLGLESYEATMATALTGLYATTDTKAGVMSFTVEPTAIDNPTSAPEDDTDDIRYILLYLSYFPGETLRSERLAFYLNPEAVQVSDAVLRRGVGQGTSFAFSTPAADTAKAAPGSLSNCYALELQDQYKKPVVNKTVTWTLTVPDALVSGSTRLVSLVDPGENVSEAYPSYVSMRRLRVAAEAPLGEYDLTLTASAEGFTKVMPIHLTVEEDAMEDLTVKLSGTGLMTIPMYYAKYNDTTPNNAVATSVFTAALSSGGSYEVDSSSYRILWSIADGQGSLPTGVSVTAGSDPTTATLKVTRDAQPTGTAQSGKVRVTVTVKSMQGVTLATDTAYVELARSASVPTLMYIYRGTGAISADSYTLSTSQSYVSKDYVFYLRDQYNQPCSLNDQKQVKWTMTSGTIASLETLKDEEGVPYARVTVNNPNRSYRGTIYLMASITFAEATATSGQVTVQAQIPLNITVEGSGGGGGAGGAVGGGGSGDDSGTSTLGVPKSITISCNEAMNVNQGTAATQTLNCTLRDKDGNTCSFTEHNKVAWSASGLSGGITFSASSRVLTVPATVPAGTYTVTVTAKYSATLSTSKTIKITVKGTEPEASPSPSPQPSEQPDTGTVVPAPTITPAVTQTGAAATVTLTAAQELSIVNSTEKGGTVTIVPTGGNGATSMTVSLSAEAVKAMTTTNKNQSLKVQTALGTVTMPATSLSALAAKGGKTAQVSISSTGTALSVDFTCGAKAGELPGAIALKAPVSGNVAVQVNPDGSETVMKKAVVQDGQLLTYLEGSTQVKMEDREPVFRDTKGHWASDYITFTTARELFQGTSANTFSPNDTMTRSMVVTVLHRLEDAPAAAATASFADVAKGEWYSSAVDWANANKIVQGTQNGFEPGNPVTREQLATILYRYAGVMGVPVNQRTSLAGFSDGAKVQSWAKDAMQWAVSAGLINGKSGGVLDPAGNASRAEVSAILQRLIVYMAPSV